MIYFHNNFHTPASKGIQHLRVLC